jgi:hypothetical protein
MVPQSAQSYASRGQDSAQPKRLTRIIGSATMLRAGWQGLPSQSAVFLRSGIDSLGKE